jgi:hypothetical protein
LEDRQLLSAGVGHHHHHHPPPHPSHHHHRHPPQPLFVPPLQLSEPPPQLPAPVARAIGTSGRGLAPGLSIVAIATASAANVPDGPVSTFLALSDGTIDEVTETPTFPDHFSFAGPTHIGRPEEEAAGGFINRFDAGTDSNGAPMVVLKYDNGDAFEFSDSLGWRSLGTNIAAVVAGQFGLSVTVDATARGLVAHTDGPHGGDTVVPLPSSERGNIVQVSAGTITVDVVFANGDAWEWSSFYGWELMTSGNAVSSAAGEYGVSDVLLNNGQLFQFYAHTQGWNLAPVELADHVTLFSLGTTFNGNPMTDLVTNNQAEELRYTFAKGAVQSVLGPSLFDPAKSPNQIQTFSASNYGVSGVLYTDGSLVIHYDRWQPGHPPAPPIDVEVPL